jgi:hypothetical protein
MQSNAQIVTPLGNALEVTPKQVLVGAGFEADCTYADYIKSNPDSKHPAINWLYTKVESNAHRLLRLGLLAVQSIPEVVNA